MVAGSTHASSVIPELRCRDAESGTETVVDVPLNARAPPYLPSADHVPSCTAPSLPLPVWSVSVDPAPSLKPYAATSPGGAGSAWYAATYVVGVAGAVMS